MRKTLTLQYSFNNYFHRNRYVFMDDEGFYYFWQLDFSEYGIEIEIIAMKIDNYDFIIVETPKTNMLIEYLKELLETQNSTFIARFFESINDFNFIIDAKYINIFGEKFCNIFLSEQDREFILRDKHAKHLMINFDKIIKREFVFFYQPELFPLYIHEIDVTVTQDAKLFKNNEEINIESFWDYYEKYKFTLEKIIREKEKIFSSLEKDLERRYNKVCEQIKKEKNISDYEVDAHISTYDGFFNDYEISTLMYTQHFFNDKDLYSLAVFDFDIKVHRVLYHLIDTFGIKIVTAKLYFWSEVKTRNQKFFNI